MQLRISSVSMRLPTRPILRRRVATEAGLGFGIVAFSLIVPQVSGTIVL